LRDVRHGCIWLHEYAYAMLMEIEWDADKAVAIFKKHGVRFEEAATSLLDPQALAQEDAHSERRSIHSPATRCTF
jgi:uncharacterized DUF497 family protein